MWMNMIVLRILFTPCLLRDSITFLRFLRFDSNFLPTSFSSQPYSLHLLTTVFLKEKYFQSEKFSLKVSPFLCPYLIPLSTLDCIHTEVFFFNFFHSCSFSTSFFMFFQSDLKFCYIPIIVLFLCPTGKYVGSRPIKLRKSTWKERNVEVVKKKQKERSKLGLL